MSLSKASEVMSGVPVSKRPLGYLFIESQYKNLNEVHKCEINFHYGPNSVTLTCVIRDISRESRRYSLLIFRDDGLTNPLLFADVCYVDLSGKTAHDAEGTECFETKWCHATREAIRMLLSAIHVIMYY